MGKAKKSFDKYPSTPILNRMNAQSREDFLQILNQESKLLRKISIAANYPNGRLIDHCKSRLGRQNYVYTTWRRYYVWEKIVDGKLFWRMFVQQDKGTAFEVAPNASIDIIRNVLNDLKVLT